MSQPTNSVERDPHSQLAGSKEASMLYEFASIATLDMVPSATSTSETIAVSHGCTIKTLLEIDNQGAINGSVYTADHNYSEGSRHVDYHFGLDTETSWVNRLTRVLPTTEPWVRTPPVRPTPARLLVHTLTKSQQGQDVYPGLLPNVDELNEIGRAIHEPLDAKAYYEYAQRLLGQADEQFIRPITSEHASGFIMGIVTLQRRPGTETQTTTRRTAALDDSESMQISVTTTNGYNEAGTAVDASISDVVIATGKYMREHDVIVHPGRSLHLEVASDTMFYSEAERSYDNATVADVDAMISVAASALVNSVV